jgi:putative membrane protein
METTTLSLILASLQTGLPVLMLHFVTTLVLLGIGIVCYMAITPFNERMLIVKGNAAAGTVLAGTILALAIPLAATLATSALALDILLWGLVALILQLLTFAFATMLIKGLRSMIEAGNVAAALGLVANQIAVALLNAGAMAG